MSYVTLPDTTDYHNLYSIASLAVGSSVVITNTTSYPIEVIKSTTQPSNDTKGIEISPLKSHVVNGVGPFSLDVIWLKGKTGKILVQDIMDVTGTYTQVDLPQDVWTTGNESYRRLKVDPGQSSFMEGREFRTFKELEIPAGATHVIKVENLGDMDIKEIGATLVQGYIRLRSYKDGAVTAGSPTPLPLIRKNGMSVALQPLYNSNITLTYYTAATYNVTGSEHRDTIYVKVANATAQQTSAGSVEADVRGIGAGAYYWVFENLGNDAVKSVFYSWWSESDPIT